MLRLHDNLFLWFYFSKYPWKLLLVNVRVHIICRLATFFRSGFVFPTIPSNFYPDALWET